MRVLLVPMAAMAETSGPSGRCIAAVAEQLINSPEMAENAGRLGNKLVSAGGVNKILREMLKM